MSLGFKPYLVALASLLAGASVVHAILEPDLVSERAKTRKDREEDKEREKTRRD